MRHLSPPSHDGSSISLRIGHWFEARGTGWGVIAVPLLLLVIVLLADGRLAHAPPQWAALWRLAGARSA